MYCVRCGKLLPGQYNKCHKCRDDASPTAWYCPYCGSGVRESDKKCEVCKKKLDLSPAMYVTTPAGKQRSRAVTLILAFALGFTGLHFKYLGFDKKFVKRLVWAFVSAAVAFGALLTFQNGINPAFSGGEVDYAILENLTSFMWICASFIVAGALSFLASWGAGFVDAAEIIGNRNYQDADGEYLKMKEKKKK